MADLMEKTLNRLAQQVQGRLSVAGDDDFTAATAIWAKPAGGLPRAVVHCRTPQEVQHAVRAARDCDMPLSVRGGGHDWAGRALCAGIVIDVSRMNHVAIGRDDRTIRIAGGARAWDAAAATDAVGAAVVTGSVGAVGMAGLTLGGGYGPLIGRFGLALDNLLLAEVVLADGRIVVATHDRERELFWALRGGGGNFGVVTDMRHRLHDVPCVRSGLLVYPFAEAKSVLEDAAEIASAAPAALTIQLGAVSGSDGPPVVFIAPTWCGEPEHGEAQTAPFRSLGTLLADTVQTIPYGVALTTFDGYLVNGQRVFMETCSVPTLGSNIIESFVASMASAPSRGCAILTHEFKGAASCVPAGSTAFGLRRDHVLIEILASFPDRSDPHDEAQHRRWTRETRQRFDATALPGGYPNFLAPGDTQRAAQSYGRNAEVLVQAKRRYDPDNVFHSAIPLPAGAATADAA